ncbi:MAG: BatA domain-containing protein [Bacteroidia bacterium]
MTFLAPEFLWVLPVLGIPILVHFFYLRRSREWVFPQLYWIQKAQQASRTAIKFHQWLLLALRMAFLLSLVLLFANPSFSSASSKGPAAHLVILDDSPSMQGEAFESAKVLIQKMLQELSYEDRVAILPLSQVYTPPRFGHKKVVLEKLSSLRVQDASFSFGEAFRLLPEYFAGEALPKKIYLLTDRQKSTFQMTSASLVGYEVYLFDLPGLRGSNAYWDSVWIQKTSGTLWELGYKVGGAAGRLQVRTAEGTLGSFPLQKEGTLSVPISGAFPSHIHLRIEGDEIAWDNDTYMGLYEGDSAQRIYLHTTASEPVRNALKQAFLTLGVSYTEVGMGLPPPSARMLIWIEPFMPTADGLRALRTWVSQGGIVVLGASPTWQTALWQENFFLSDVQLHKWDATAGRAGELNPHPIWQEIFELYTPHPQDLPQSQGLWVVNAPQAQVLWQDDQGNPMLISYALGRGSVFFFPFAWSNSDLVRRSLFIPLWDRIVAMGLTGHRQVLAVPANRVKLSLPGSTLPTRIEGPGGSFPVPTKPDASGLIALEGRVFPVGVYSVYAGRERIAYFGVNTPKAESELTYYEMEELEKLLQAAGAKVRILDLYKDGTGEIMAVETMGTWRFLGFMALIFLLMEGWLMGRPPVSLKKLVSRQA